MRRLITSRHIRIYTVRTRNSFGLEIRKDYGIFFLIRAPGKRSILINVERPLCDREVAGSIPGRVIPKTLKMVLAALSLGAQH